MKQVVLEKLFVLLSWWRDVVSYSCMILTILTMYNIVNIESLLLVDWNGKTHVGLQGVQIPYNLLTTKIICT